MAGAVGLRGVLLLALLLVGSAAAAPGAGEIILRGSLRLPADSNADASPLAIWLNDSAGVSSFSLSAPRVIVHSFEAQPLIVRAGVVEYRYDAETRRATYELRDVRGQLVEGADPSGWMGVYVAPGARTELHGDQIVSSSRNATLVGNSRLHEDEPVPEWPVYGQLVEGPHAVVGGAGRLVYEGAGALKFAGLDVVLWSSNTTRHETHEPSPGGPVSQSQQAWALWEFPDGVRIVLETSLPVEIAASDAQLSWSGRALLTAATGTLRTSTARYELAGGPTTLDGTLSASFSPITLADGPAGVLDVAGDVDAMSQAAIPLPLSERLWASPGPAWLVILGTLAVLAGAAYAALRYRMIRAPGLMLWALRARFHSTKGEAELRFAELLAGVAGDFELAEKWVCEALRRNPLLVLEVDESEALEPIRDRQAYKAAVARARNSLPPA